LYKNFTEIVPGEPLRWGLNPRGVAKYSNFRPFKGYLSETMQDMISVCINCECNGLLVEQNSNSWHAADEWAEGRGVTNKLAYIDPFNSFWHKNGKCGPSALCSIATSFDFQWITLANGRAVDYSNFVLVASYTCITGSRHDTIA